MNTQSPTTLDEKLWAAEAENATLRSEVERLTRERNEARRASAAYEAWKFPADIQDLTVRLEAAEASLQQMTKALEPFAKIKPSALYPADGSENEEYIVTLKEDYGNPAEITGKDLANARAALAIKEESR